MYDEYNTLQTAVKTDLELFRISETVKHKIIFCHEFDVSQITIDSLSRNENRAVGTGIDANMLLH